MMDIEKRSANILIRVAPSLKESADRIAKTERRSLSAWIEGLIVREVAALDADSLERGSPRKSREKVPD
jgi:hypothetical protein